MGKNAIFRETYSSPEYGNVRYKSDAKESVAGWAYVHTTDNDYVSDLSLFRIVQIRHGDAWIAYTGTLPDEDVPDEVPNSSHRMDDDVDDPNYEG